MTASSGNAAPRPRSAGEMPYPPRLLSREQAAAYLGLSPTSFDSEVKAGTFPQPVMLRRTKRRLWDVAELDRMLDMRSTVQVEDTGGNWDERKARWQKSRQGRAQGLGGRDR